MMNICLVHFRVGDIDGVSLEMDKWRRVLEDMGHQVIYLAGSLGQSQGFLIPELGLEDKNALLIRKNAFTRLDDFASQDVLWDYIQTRSHDISKKIKEFFLEEQIDLVIPNNMFSLPINITASLGLLQAIDDLSLPAIVHSHDFYWERTVYQPTCPKIMQILEESFPPDRKNFKHVVINSLAKNDLFVRRGLKAKVVPNVFYFDEEPWIIDDYNQDVRENLGLDKNDIIILQATRIVERKGIELIIDLISELNKPTNREKLEEKPLFDGRVFSNNNRIGLVLPNIVEDDEYLAHLKSKASELKVDCIYCNDIFSHTRHILNGKKIYSLFLDSYVHADLISYPSLQEGWGNQFLEALKAKKPIILFEYDVYKSDIKPLGFETISLGSSLLTGRDSNNLVSVPEKVIRRAAELTIEFLQNKELREKVVDKNFQIGKEKLSLKALEGILKKILPVLDSS
ncbi:MAG: glycosyltransferase family 4 protein [Candidatus Hodarchaeales archaeon]